MGIHLMRVLEFWYPLYYSLKAAGKPDKYKYGEDKYWLTYWAVYGLFTAIEDKLQYVI